jgi:hypothetical protein
MDATSVGQVVLQIIAAIYWFITTVIILPFVNVAYYYCLLKPLSYIRYSTNAVSYHACLPSYAHYVRIENQMARWTNQHWTATFAWYGLRVVESGDDVRLLSEQRCILMANHAGLIDHFVLMAALNDKGSVSGRVGYAYSHRTPTFLI